MSYIKELMRNIPQTGKVEWVGVRPERRGTVREVEAVTVHVENGLEGDHYSGTNGKRQVTLIQAEHLATMASILEKEQIDPGLTRRNIVVSGINLLAFTDQQFQIGEAILEMTGQCHPCSRMEENLGKGGYNAMRGHGGITASVVKGGTIKVGDKVKLI
ncbi:MAG: MOSC domain-containing protein [Saprospiraceae bacterium]